MKEDILPIWQPVGFSTHEIARKLAEKHGVKTSHTGVIDPMAEGVVIVLLGEERLKKYEYAKWKKAYEFEVVFGLKTDTYDGLGLVEICGDDVVIEKKSLEDVLTRFVGPYTQQYPAYSSKVVKGKPLHWYSRNEKLDEVDIPEKSGEIYSIELLDLNKIDLSDVVSDVISRVDLVEGDFRQEKIKGRWDSTLRDVGDLSLSIAKVRVCMSKGMYVRGLAVDIASKLNTCG